MNNWKKYSFVLVTAVFLILVSGISVFAQDDDDEHPDTNARSIRGSVYLDVNLDGRCINTGVEGEVAVAGIPVEFTSSNGEHVINLQTGDDGTYGLVAVGHDTWTITAKPNAAEYVVTSTNPLSATISDDNRIETGVDFCVAKGSGAGGVIGGAPGIIVLPVMLPESGAPAQTVNVAGMLVLATAVFGFTLIALGAGLEWRRRTNRS